MNAEHEWKANTLTKRIIKEYFFELPKEDIDAVYDYIRNYILFQQESHIQTEAEKRPDTPRLPPKLVRQAPQMEREQKGDSESDTEDSDTDDEPPCAIVNTSDEEEAEPPAVVNPWTRHFIDSQDVYLQVRSLHEQYVKHRPFIGSYQFYVDIFY